MFAYTNKDVDALNKDLRAVRRERGELGEDFVFTTKHGEAAFAIGDRVQFTDALKGAGIYNGNAGVITSIDRNFGRIGVVLDAAAGREGWKVEWYASEFSGFRHGYAGTIYKGQGKTLDHTYLMHTHHWRAVSSYVALTRQRESATIFVATQTARDLRQLAQQIGRNEIKSASVAYATRDELSAEQRAKLDEGRAAENARPALHVGQALDGREKRSSRWLQLSKGRAWACVRQIGAHRKCSPAPLPRTRRASAGLSIEARRLSPSWHRSQKRQETAIVVGQPPTIGSWQTEPKIGRRFQMPEMKRGRPAPQPTGQRTSGC
ncbi:hypothetical protein [Mesorhizobium sp. M0684]|uniref:hypothetical protein n=1 Tax=Mesorhizobium sp. M0684 TaxID=2956986 RepID=UPI003335E4EF